jgi:hypothetical protein
MNRTSWVLAGVAGVLGLSAVLSRGAETIIKPIPPIPKSITVECPKEDLKAVSNSPAPFEVRTIRPPAAGGSALERPVARGAGDRSDHAVFRSGSISPDIWVHEGDSDGDGLMDEFELRHGLDPRKACTFDDEVPDEERIAPDGRTYGAIQEAEKKGEPCRHQGWASTPSR